MRVQDPREHPPKTMVSQVRYHPRQGREHGQEHGCGRAEVQPQRASRRSNGRGTGTGERDPNPQSRWRQAKSTSKSINQFDRDLAEPENASHVMLCPDDMLLQDYSWRRFALWFPEFNPVAFGIDDPSEFAVFVFLSLIVDFHAFPFELIQ